MWCFDLALRMGVTCTMPLTIDPALNWVTRFSGMKATTAINASSTVTCQPQRRHSKARTPQRKPSATRRGKPARAANNAPGQPDDEPDARRAPRVSSQKVNVLWVRGINWGSPCASGFSGARLRTKTQAVGPSHAHQSGKLWFLPSWEDFIISISD
jgi:hypothetical protein